MIKGLLTHRYERIFFDSGRTDTLIGITKPIVVEYGGHTINLGQYKVTIDLRNINIVSLETQRPLEYYHHPHIDIHHICWGDWVKYINELHSTMSYAELLLRIHEFLCKPNEAGWFKDIRYWLADANKRCKSCWELTKQCSCERDDEECEVCGEYTDNCSCSRCPESGEVIADGIPDRFCVEECHNWNNEDRVCEA